MEYACQGQIPSKSSSCCASRLSMSSRPSGSGSGGGSGGAAIASGLDGTDVATCSAEGRGGAACCAV